MDLHPVEPRPLPYLKVKRSFRRAGVVTGEAVGAGTGAEVGAGTGFEVGDCVGGRYVSSSSDTVIVVMPVGHVEQLVCPLLSWYVFVAHSVQIWADAEEYRPAGQSLQLVWALACFPAAHATQLVALDAVLYLPQAQLVQSLASTVE